MVEGATALMRTHGFTATSFKDVWERTGTPRGSVYFHFPDGKAELGAEVIRAALETLLRWTEDAEGEADSAAEFVQHLAAKPAEFLESTDGEQGCPIAAIAIERPVGFPGLGDAAKEAFAAWSARVAEGFERFGVPRAASGELAVATVSALEGAIVLSKADGSTRALELAAELVVRALPAYRGERQVRRSPTARPRADAARAR